MISILKFIELISKFKPKLVLFWNWVWSFLLFAHFIYFKKQIRFGHTVKLRLFSAVPKWYDEPWKGRTAHEPYFWLNNVYLCDIFQKNILASWKSSKIIFRTKAKLFCLIYPLARISFLKYYIKMHLIQHKKRRIADLQTYLSSLIRIIGKLGLNCIFVSLDFFFNDSDRNISCSQMGS